MADSIETFSVYMYYPDDTYTCEASHINAEAAVHLAKGLCTRPAVRLGIIKRIIIVDSGDMTVFEWKHGEGVTFPVPKTKEATHA